MRHRSPSLYERSPYRTGADRGLEAAIRLCAALTLLGAGCSRAGSAQGLPNESDLYRYAVAVAERTVRLVGEDDARALFVLGRVHQRFGREAEALKVYRRGLELDPTAADIYREIGFILSQQKDRQPQALDAYQESIRYDPEQKGIYGRIALILIHQGRLDEAAEAARHEIEVWGEDPMAFYHLAQAHRLAGRHREAVAAYRKALELDPEMRMAWYGLATSLRILGDEAEADKALERFTELRARDEERDRRAEARKTNEEDLRRHASRAWSESAELFFERASKAKEHAEVERWRREAFEALGHALRLDPMNPHAVPLLDAVVTAELSRPQEARRIIDRLLAIAPDCAFLHLEGARATLALAAQARSGPGGRSRERELAERAARELEKAVELDPKLAEAHHMLARTLLLLLSDSSRNQAALEHARKSVDVAVKPRPDYYDILALAYYRNRDVRSAYEALRQGVERFPESVKLKDRLRAFEQQYLKGGGAR